MTNCCSASREPQGQPDQTNQPLDHTEGSVDGMVYLSGGPFLMGSEDPSFPADGEGPVREVSVDPFWIDPKVVTNAQFAVFVEETGYRTDSAPETPQASSFPNSKRCPSKNGAHWRGTGMCYRFQSLLAIENKGSENRAFRFPALKNTGTDFSEFPKSVSHPLDRLEVDAFFVHVPERRQLAQALHLLS